MLCIRHTGSTDDPPAKYRDYTSEQYAELGKYAVEIKAAGHLSQLLVHVVSVNVITIW